MHLKTSALWWLVNITSTHDSSWSQYWFQQTPPQIPKTTVVVFSKVFPLPQKNNNIICPSFFNYITHGRTFIKLICKGSVAVSKLNQLCFSGEILKSKGLTWLRKKVFCAFAFSLSARGGLDKFGELLRSLGLLPAEIQEIFEIELKT